MRHDPWGNPLHVRMYHKHGAYWYVHRGKWHRLGQTYPAAMQSYAAWVAPSGGMEKLVDDTYRWMERRVDRGELAPRSLRQYQTVRERISTAFSDFSPEQVKPSHVSQFVEFYFEDSPSQGNITLAVLRSVFTRGVKWGQCEYNPAREIENFKLRPRDRYLTDEEFVAIRRAGPSWLRPILDMCYLTGQRIGDVLHIKQADITEEGIYFQQQKSRKRLLVEATPELSTLVAESRGQSTVVGVYLFAKSATVPRSYNAVQKAFQSACKAAGVLDARIHDIRAKALTDADSEGLDAQRLAGHATRGMTERYLRVLRTDRVQGPGNVAILRQSKDKGG